MPLLETHNLIKTYDGRRVVDRVGFEVGEREIVGLLGRNGAGKTTSFRITVGMIASDEGRVMLAGEDISHLPMYQRARRGLGYLSQEPSVFQRLSVEDNLLAILESLKGLSAADRRKQAGELMERFGLTVNARQLARTLSGGERRKLEIARALITSPRLLLLDEPFSGVDPIAVHDLQRDILKLRDERGISILLTDHNVREILSITDRSYILDEGKVLRHGTPKELITDEVVRRTYLGDTFRGDEFD
ncbi:MAG: LPS export ABC transporter ATP-binding protein [Planctomycetes bacterium]|nr:LPS export ABC transporter ATP-binding protein [Planctomycetota bacterium]MCH8963374.1 LPS export ABC transporter ATP-binding protein [Planctomycetota bacterium]